jgi:hypothetical protein
MLICHCQTYQNYQYPPQRLQNSDFQSQFLCQKLSESFYLIFFILGAHFLLLILLDNFNFKALYFLKMGPIFAACVDHFGRSDYDMIQ